MIPGSYFNTSVFGNNGFMYGLHSLFICFRLIFGGMLSFSKERRTLMIEAIPDAPSVCPILLLTEPNGNLSFLPGRVTYALYIAFNSCRSPTYKFELVYNDQGLLIYFCSRQVSLHIRQFKRINAAHFIGLYHQLFLCFTGREEHSYCFPSVVIHSRGQYLRINSFSG